MGILGSTIACVLLVGLLFIVARSTFDDILGINDDDSTPIALNTDDPSNAGQGGNQATATSLPGFDATRNPNIIPTPDGDLLFVSNRSGQWEIWVMESDGSNPVAITNSSPDINYSPGWSPDGTQIVFEARRNNNWDIYVMNADGSNIQRLTTNSAVDRVPVWSPDGSVIAFSSNRQGDYDIHLINPDGS